MQASTSQGSGIAHQEEPPARRRRYIFYFLLAGFDVFAVCASLYLNHRIMAIYVQSVAVNQGWAETQRDSSQLGQAVAAINAPGNNVFESRQVDAEAQLMRRALVRCEEHFEALKKRLASDSSAEWNEKFDKDLMDIQLATLGMANEAERLFEAFRSDRITEAGSHMARMDRYYEDAHQQLFRLREHISKMQKDLFRSQTASAVALQKFEYAIAGLILLMVSGATYYGYQTAQQEDDDAKTREQARQRKQEIETRTRVLKQVMAAQEEERRRIARDLHDEVGQSVASLLMGLRTVDAAESVQEARSRNEHLRRIALLVLDDVKRMARGLRPIILDDYGLVPAIEHYANDFSQAYGIAVVVRIKGLDSERLPENIETALYRITQESLTNVIKHASARHVWIEIEREAEQVRIAVSDDGCGFDPCTLSAKGGLGLSGMRERVALLEGNVVVESKPGRGTSIIVRLPLEEVIHGDDVCTHCG